MSIIRDNLMTQKGYSPYCGSIGKRCSMPRTTFTGTQFKCSECGWVSSFDEKFIAAYKTKWSKPV